MGKLQMIRKAVILDEHYANLVVIKLIIIKRRFNKTFRLLCILKFTRLFFFLETSLYNLQLSNFLLQGWTVTEKEKVLRNWTYA